MRGHGIAVTVGDTALLRPVDAGSWEIMRRHRLAGGREIPLIIPAIDPDVEYLMQPGEPGWLHPYKPLMYDWYDDYDQDLSTWMRLAREADGPILELACGTGRVLLELARAGHQVTGVDFSRPMLDRAIAKLATEPEAVRRRVELIHADMTSWSGSARFRLAFIACNGLHFMGSTSPRPALDMRRKAIETLLARLERGGLGVISNLAPAEREPPSSVLPASHLVLRGFGRNPNTGRWTADYQGRWVDDLTGQRYDGPWRFVEYQDDGRVRAFEFASVPPVTGKLDVSRHPAPLTRDETVALMREVGFDRVEVRAPAELGEPGRAGDVAVFLGRKP